MINRSFMLTILPFFCYIVGYFCCAQILHNKTLIVPTVVGTSLHNGVVTLSKKNLRSLIIKELEDVSVPQGTIIEQIPYPKQNIKENQVVYLTISTQPTQLAPSLITHTIPHITQLTNQQGLNVHVHQLPAAYTATQAFGQFPSAGSPLAPGQSLIVYTAIESKKTFIWPNMYGKDLRSVQSFLEQYQITPTVLSTSKDRVTEDAIVIEQRPIAGSLVYISSLATLVVQLLVQTKSGQKNAA